MWLGLVTIFPDVVRNAMSEGVVGRAVARGDLHLELFNPRDFAINAFGQVDDRPFGGGPGMVLRAEPLADCVEKARGMAPISDFSTVYLSPQGERFDQAMATEMSQEKAILFVAGRYEGVDERFIQNFVDREVSIGDYVLSGGEFAALVIIDVLGRLVKGTVSNPASIESDSFSTDLLDHPQYTRPREVFGDSVPQVLLSGDHDAITSWRLKRSVERTWKRRPDLLLEGELTLQQRQALATLLASDCLSQ